MLDFVPLAGAGRQVADHDVEAEFVGQLLQFAFPQPDPRAVAASAIGGDQQPDRVGVTRPPKVEPPLADAVHREGGCVMVDADTHPPGIRSQIIDAIGHRSAEFLDEEVVHPDLFRTPLRPILAAIVAEIADQFLLLGVDRDHWLLFGQSSGHLGVDMGELRIPVEVAVTLLGLAVSLQAVTRRIEQFGHQGAAYLVALLLQRFGQSSHAFAGPPQRRFRIPPRRRFDQRLEIRDQCRVLDDRWLASRPRPPNPLRWVVLRQFLQTPSDRAQRHAGCHRHRGNAAITCRKRLRRRDQTTAAFVEKRCYCGKPLSNGFNIDHHHNIWYRYSVVNLYFTLSKVDSMISGQVLSPEPQVRIHLPPAQSLPSSRLRPSSAHTPFISAVLVVRIHSPPAVSLVRTSLCRASTESGTLSTL